MRRETLAELEQRRGASGRPYLESLREASMSVGLYTLAAGAVDGQSPHAEDEVYVVLSGHAGFTSGGETVAAGPGDVLWVPAREEHRFHDITDTLQLIVVFAPAEGSRAGG